MTLPFNGLEQNMALDICHMSDFEFQIGYVYNILYMYMYICEGLPRPI